MTILELLKEIRRFDGNFSREQNNRYYVLETKIENLKNEHEALKHDIARYFETRNSLKIRTVTENDIAILHELEEKLSKIGKEE